MPEFPISPDRVSIQYRYTETETGTGTQTRTGTKLLQKLLEGLLLLALFSQKFGSHPICCNLHGIGLRKIRFVSTSITQLISNKPEPEAL